MSLDLQYKSDGSWTNCFTLKAPEHSFNIPSVAYLGFSGETGEVSDNQDIISVTTNNLYSISNNPNVGDSGSVSGGRGRKSQDKKGGSWSWFFFKVFMFFGAVGGSYVGWTIYKTNNKRYSRF
jgi:mannose-binding lectin 2